MSGDEIRDELPAELDVSAFVGPNQFPDNSRRRIPAAIYLFVAVICVVIRIGYSSSTSGLVNNGMVMAAVILGVFGIYGLTSSWRIEVDEKQALVLASRAANFPVGHASAQQVWLGLRSRPTWRVFCYSTEEPPLKRGLVLVDAIDGEIMQCLSESNPDLQP
ncbi:MAG: hypothetical protein ABI590_06440 [Ilumatobacteraceae bacterium]